MAEWTAVTGKLADGLRMRLLLAELDGKLCGAGLEDDLHPTSEDEFLWRLDRAHAWVRRKSGAGSEALRRAAAQIADYFAGRRLSFDLPLELKGTPFQLRVWRELTRIPFAQTRSYAEIAEQIGQPTACRAVGNANGKNRIPLIVPCHRVIGAGGNLAGFTGGIGLKKRLLAHEAAVLGTQHAA